MSWSPVRALDANRRETGKALARWRGELMRLLPVDHPVHDPTRAYTSAELERFTDDVQGNHVHIVVS